MNANLEFNIDQFILHGFSNREAFYIGRAFREEMTRLIQKKGLPKTWNQQTEIPNLDAGQFSLSTRFSRPELIGKQLANKVYESFSNQNSSK